MGEQTCPIRVYVGEDWLPLFFCDLPAGHEGIHNNSLLVRMRGQGWPPPGSVMRNPPDDDEPVLRLVPPTTEGGA